LIIAGTGLVTALGVAWAAGNVLGGRADFKAPKIQVELRTPEKERERQATATQLAQVKAAQQPLAGETPKDIRTACEARNPRSKAKQSDCVKQELDGLEYLEVFPAGWSFATTTSDDTMSAIDAGNPGAIMFQKCLRLHGSRRSADGFPHYARMKTCLITEQEAHNTR
jgi:hypothetical protein